MNIWKTTLLLVLLFTGITVHAQKVKISLNSDGNLTIWKVKAQAEIEHPSDMMTTRYDTRDWVKATVPGTVFGSYVLEGLEPDPNFADNAYKVDKASNSVVFQIFISSISFSHYRSVYERLIAHIPLKKKSDSHIIIFCIPLSSCTKW